MVYQVTVKQLKFGEQEVFTGNLTTNTGDYRWVDNYDNTGSWAVIHPRNALVRQESKKINSRLFKEAVLYDNVAKTNDS